jgi:hypothetical protein
MIHGDEINLNLNVNSIVKLTSKINKNRAIAPRTWNWINCMKTVINAFEIQ